MEHSFSVELAIDFGIQEAVLIRHFQFWILKNRSCKKHKYENRTWTYGSAKELSTLFPYLSPKQVERTIKRLVDSGVILTKQMNVSDWDRTLWYAFVNEKQMLGPTLTKGVRRQMRAKKERE